MRIYLDTCCYNRAAETSEQENMMAEIYAVKNVLDAKDKRNDVIIGSYLVYDEICGINNIDRRASVLYIFISIALWQTMRNALKLI